MEHIHVAYGHISAMGWPIAREFYREARYDGTLIRGVVTPTARALARRRLPSCSIALEAWSHSFHGTPFMGWSPFITTGPVNAYRRLRRSHAASADRLRWGVARLWALALIARSASGEFNTRTRHIVDRAMDRRLVSLYFRAEQVPDPASRVSLSSRRDKLGVPLTRLDWRIGDADLAGITSWLTALDSTLESAGVGHVVRPAEGWEAGVIGGPHHMGTTRMSDDPRDGVVDGTAASTAWTTSTSREFRVHDERVRQSYVHDRRARVAAR